MKKTAEIHVFANRRARQNVVPLQYIVLRVQNKTRSTAVRRMGGLKVAEKLTIMSVNKGSSSTQSGFKNTISYTVDRK